MRVRIGDNELEVSGPSGFVEKKIAEFVELNKEKTCERGISPKTSAPQAGHRSTASSRQISAAQFFKKVKARTAVDRVLAAGYYLEVLCGAENFTAAEIRDTIQKKAKIPPPKNPSDLVNNNIQKGYMMAAGDKDGRMAFVLTSDGEEFIKSSLEQ